MKIALIIITIALVLALVIGGLYIGLNNITDQKKLIAEQMETIENLQDLVDRKDFAWIAADMEVDNLEQIIASKDELILELKVEEQILLLYKETLEYTLTWVYYAQELMTYNGISYFEYIGEQVLSEVYFEELQEQNEVFEGLGE